MVVKSSALKKLYVVITLALQDKISTQKVISRPTLITHSIKGLFINANLANFVFV